MGATMDIRSIELNRGWGLFGHGWKNFTADPLTWVLVVVVFFLISLVLNLIPLLGGVLMAIITPALMAGFLKIAHDIDQGHKVGVSHLFQPIQDQKRRVPLLLLGLVALLATVLMAVVMAVFIGGAVQIGATGESVRFPLAGVGFFGMFVIFMMYLVVFAILAFSIPLVYFRDEELGDAIVASIKGTLTNLGPLVIFSLIYFALAFLAMLPFGLGFLVLAPVVFAALYGAYSEIFPGSLEPEVLEAEEV